MSKLAHVCFTLIIYEQFNFCHFRASVYTKVDRLCAVFLYNICCLYKFIETSTPIEIHWITLIRYKNDSMPKRQKTTFIVAATAMLNCRTLLFWSRDLYLHVILHLRSKLHFNRPIWRRDIAKNTFQYGVRPPSWICKISIFFVKYPSWELKSASAYQIWSESDDSLLRYWHAACFKMAAVRHLEFAKIAVLVTSPISACDSSSCALSHAWTLRPASWDGPMHKSLGVAI